MFSMHCGGESQMLCDLSLKGVKSVQWGFCAKAVHDGIPQFCIHTLFPRCL